MIIDNKEYYFDGFTKDSKLTNILGSVYEDSKSKSDEFWFKLNDLDSISLIEIKDGGEH